MLNTYTHTPTNSNRKRMLPIGSAVDLKEPKMNHEPDRQNKTIIGDFNTPFPSIDRSRQKINKDIKNFKSTNRIYQIDIYRILHPMNTIQCSNKHRTFSKMDHIFSNEINLYKLKTIEIT